MRWILCKKKRKKKIKTEQKKATRETLSISGVKSEIIIMQYVCHFSCFFLSCIQNPMWTCDKSQFFLFIFWISANEFSNGRFCITLTLCWTFRCFNQIMCILIIIIYTHWLQSQVVQNIENDSFWIRNLKKTFLLIKFHKNFSTLAKIKKIIFSINARQT